MGNSCVCDSTKTEDIKRAEQIITNCDRDSSSSSNDDKSLVKVDMVQQGLNNLKHKYKEFEILKTREMVIIGDSSIKESNSLSIMQFNMLADGLSGCYLKGESEKTFIGVDKRCLSWEYRGLRVIEEILRFHPDLLCMQECDKVEFIQKYLEPQGYKCYFQPKNPSSTSDVEKEIFEEQGIQVNLPPDGVLIAFDTKKFQIIPNEKVQYIDMQENKEKVIGLALPLETLTMESNQKFLLVTTHLKSTKEKEGELKRVNQIRSLINNLIQNPNDLPIVLAADLNATPFKNKKGYDPLCYQTVTNELKFKSIYKESLQGEPEYTTWKLRQGGTDKQVLDYIFYRDINLKIISYLSIPAASSELKSLIPSWDYPSDHFSIMAKIVLY